MAAGKRDENLARVLGMRMKVALDMFRAMHSTDCLFEQARLSLVHMQTIFGYVPLRLGQSERPVSEFMSDVLGLHGERLSGMVTRDEHEERATTLREHDTAWMQYVDAIYEQLSTAARIVLESSTAWAKQQRKFFQLENAA